MKNNKNYTTKETTKSELVKKIKRYVEKCSSTNKDEEPEIVKLDEIDTPDNVENTLGLIRSLLVDIDSTLSRLKVGRSEYSHFCDDKKKYNTVCFTIVGKGKPNDLDLLLVANRDYLEEHKIGQDKIIKLVFEVIPGIYPNLHYNPTLFIKDSETVEKYLNLYKTKYMFK